MTVTTEHVPASALRLGDIVWTHGMRLQLIAGGQSKSHPVAENGPVFSFTGLVLNKAEVRAEKVVPWSWLTDSGTTDPQWTVQSNDRVKWNREVI